MKEVFMDKMTPEQRTAAKSECTLLEKLNHPNIVQHKEAFIEDNTLYIVMEYANGGDLHRRLRYGSCWRKT